LAFKRSEERYVVGRLRPVQKFLDSKGRRSLRTSKTYLIALVHFNNFLKLQYQDLNVETILQPLHKGEIDVYELLDAFVQYLTEQKVSEVTIDMYLVGIRSYLEFNDIDIIPAKFKKRVTLSKTPKQRASAYL
jgi:hypothetical protein